MTVLFTVTLPITLACNPYKLTLNSSDWKQNMSFTRHAARIPTSYILNSNTAKLTTCTRLSIIQTRGDPPILFELPEVQKARVYSLRTVSRQAFVNK